FGDQGVRLGRRSRMVAHGTTRHAGAEVPQLAQNLPLISAPQPVQNFLAGATARGVPHSWQNLPGGTFAWHLGQDMVPPAAVGAEGWAIGCWGCMWGGVNWGPWGWFIMLFIMPMPTAIWAPIMPAPPPSPPPLAMPWPAPIMAWPAA